MGVRHEVHPKCLNPGDVSVPSERGMGVRRVQSYNQDGNRTVSVPSERGMGVRHGYSCKVAAFTEFQSPLSGVWACAGYRRQGSQLLRVSVPSERGMGVRPRL